MKNNLSVENKVDTALSSVDDIERATPSPGFYTKLMANINRPRATVWERFTAILLLPRVAFAVIGFIIIVNCVVLYSKFSEHKTPAEVSELASSEDYTTASASLYDLENEKP